MSQLPSEEAREELRQLIASLREHLLGQLATGATGLPRASAAALHLQARVRPPSAPESSASELAVPEPSPPGSSRVADPTAELERLRKEVAGCTRCALHATRNQTVFARGRGSARLCFVGEGPGADEDAQGVPFVGAAGQLLDRMIAAMGMERDEVYISNIVKCRPPRNRKPLPEEMQACRPYLERQLELLQPEVIVALGATAAEGLLGTCEGITRLRGRWRLYRGQIAVMPTFHPAYLLRNARAKRAVWEDLQAVLRQLGRPVAGAG
jgi:uracil-DNA glycosylase family 4